jgi:hypothetical protein
VLPFLQAKRKLEEHHGRAHERHALAMERIEQKHARGVQIALEKDRVEKAGELRHQTRLASKASVSRACQSPGEGEWITRATAVAGEGTQWHC